MAPLVSCTLVPLPEKEVKCFLCSTPCETYCPMCGAGVCGPQHMEYHRPPQHMVNVTNLRPNNVDNLNCHPFRLKVGSAGRYLVATRDIQPLDLVMMDYPSVTGPMAKSNPLCLECLNPLDQTSIPCSGCRAPLCSPQCQDGQNHLPECTIFQEHNVNIQVDDLSCPNLMYAAILPLRMWLLHKERPSEWEKVNFLQHGDPDSLKNIQFWRDVVHVIRCSWGLQEISEDEILRMIGVKLTNANSLEGVAKSGIDSMADVVKSCTNNSEEKVKNGTDSLAGAAIHDTASPEGMICSGTALYPIYPLMNSYCYCNTRYVINKEDYGMEVRAQRLIAKDAEITTRYVIPTIHQPNRQRIISNNWAFQCTCARCLDARELGSFCSGVRCLECAAGYLLPSSPTMLASPWICHVCGCYVGEGEVEKVLSKAKQLCCSLASTDACEEAIWELEKVLHANHLLLIKVKQTLMVLYSQKPVSRVITDRQIQLGVSILEVIHCIDPGLTAWRGTILKLVLDPWVRVASADYSQGLISSKQFKERAKKATNMMRDMLLCLKPNNNSVIK